MKQKQDATLQQLRIDLENQKNLLANSALLSRLPDKGERVKQKVASLEKRIAQLSEAISISDMEGGEDSLVKESATREDKLQQAKNEDMIKLENSIEKLSIEDEEERAYLDEYKRRMALQDDPKQKILREELLYGTGGLGKYAPRKVIALSLEESLDLYKENVTSEDDFDVKSSAKQEEESLEKEDGNSLE